MIIKKELYKNTIRLQQCLFLFHTYNIKQNNNYKIIRYSIRF